MTRRPLAIPDPRRILRVGIVAGVLALSGVAATFPAAAPSANSLQRINHVIVIYQENHSFDNYFGNFPGADGIANAGASTVQVDRDGQPYETLPAPLANPVEGRRLPHPNITRDLPNGPFLLNEFFSPGEQFANQIHVFYRNQYQINEGRMDRFAAWSDGAGMAMGYWDISDLPLYRLAQEYTLADRFFQAAFGGSFLNHHWLICACTPTFPHAPAEMVSRPLTDDPQHLDDYQVTGDGYLVNSSSAPSSRFAYSVNSPHPADARPEQAVPNLTAPTIGDRLSAAGVSWAWYSGGWTNAIAGNPRDLFSFHQQPFAYYANYADGTEGRALHLKDETEFLEALGNGTLPAVSFVKPVGLDNEHPGSGNILRGQEHVAELVRAVQNSRYWNEAAIIITYDEFGGYWDHVAPPVVDRWGPGPRVPTVIVSPYARRGYVDHTTYDTTSILKLIETRWNVAPLGSRDAAANNLTNAFDSGF